MIAPVFSRKNKLSFKYGTGATNLIISKSAIFVVVKALLYLNASFPKTMPFKVSWSISMNRRKIPYYMGLFTPPKNIINWVVKNSEIKKGEKNE